MSRLKTLYNDEIVDAMIKKFGYKNIMEVPKLDKIVVNMGVGEAKENAKLLESAAKDLEIITGQKPVLTKAKNLLLTLRSEKVWLLDARLHCAARECTNSWIVL